MRSIIAEVTMITVAATNDAAKYCDPEEDSSVGAGEADVGLLFEGAGDWVEVFCGIWVVVAEGERLGFCVGVVVGVTLVAFQ